MRKLRSARVAIVVPAWVAILSLACGGGTPVVRPQPQNRVEAAVEEFNAILAKADAAQLELQNGRPAAFKALWSHRDDVTLAGGFGGAIEKGWDQISRRLDWVGAQYSGGTHTHERIVVTAQDLLAYVVQAEHIRFHVPGQASESTRDYRVTMVFRREPEGWRIVHRQADVQTMKQAPQ